MPSAAENVKEIGTLIDLGVKCLEGTTERSDGNRVRSARIGEAGRCAWKALRHRTSPIIALVTISATD